MKIKMLTYLSIASSFILFSCSSAEETKKADIDAIIQEMTLEEKIDFIGGFEEFNIRAYEKYGIPGIHLADGPVGVRNFGRSTAYPASINLAASFDRKLAYNTGKAIAMEARAADAHIMLGPGMNIYRMPLCGRNFEYLGEDPYLAGQLAKEYTQGMQNEGIIACAKHYVANNQDYNRHHVSSDMDERTLHEIYLPAFKTVVQEGKVGTVMTAYNLINGIHASEHDYLNNKVLKGDWGFDGFIVSDWVSTYDGLACAKGGLDLEMPSGKMMNRETLIPAIENGELDEAIIDDKIRRILKVYDRFGLLENSEISKDYTVDKDFLYQASLESARGGMVLLKNANKILPLDKNAIKKITVIGPNGSPAVTGGGGSSKVDPLEPISLVAALKEVAGDATEISYEPGVYIGTDIPEGLFDNFNFYVKKDGKKVKGVEAEYFANKKLEGEAIYKAFYDKMPLENADMWDPAEVPEVDFSARYTTYFTPEISGQYSIGGKGDDGYRIMLDGIEKLSLWREQGPTAAAFEAFLNAGQEYKIEIEYYQSGGGAYIDLGAMQIEVKVDPKDYTPNALVAAKDADLVIMAVGFDHRTESEAFDRNYELPHGQADLIRKVAAVNDNIIVVLNAGGNVEMNSWLPVTDALLMAWYPGGAGNLAAAEILFGETNPSGKLPASFEKNLEDNPCYNSYFDEDGDLRVFYTEGIFMGYRYWDQSTREPRFPFGFGLSYTEFAYSDLSTDKQSYQLDETVKVSFKLSNTGDRDGAEAVQLYVSDKECSLPRPVKELKDFAKVDLKAGEEKSVEFELSKEAFAFYNPETHAWEVEPGEFEILVGSSSADIRQKVAIVLE